jgi:hypothetical protein
VPLRAISDERDKVAENVSTVFYFGYLFVRPALSPNAPGVLTGWRKGIRAIADRAETGQELAEKRMRRSR